MKKILLMTFIQMTASYAFAAEMCSDIFNTPAAPAFVTYEALTQQRNIRPDTFVQQAVDKMVSDIDSKNYELHTLLAKPQTFSIGATRNSFTGLLYDNNLVDASDISYRMQDKLMMYKLLEHYFGPTDARAIHPYTAGVKEFLSRNNLIDQNGVFSATPAALQAALKKEFPKGFIVKPTAGENSDGRGFFFDESVIKTLLAQKQGSDIYTPVEINQAYALFGNGTPITGEHFIIQERLNIPEGNAVGSANEFRAHSYDDQVIDGATMSRWKYVSDKTAFVRVNAFLQKILNRLPKKFVDRQAWSFDVYQDAEGNLMLVEVNTNKGRRTNWSGFLKTQRVLGAYVRHFEQHFGWKFQGVSGWMLRNNLGNLKNSAKYVAEKYWSRAVTLVLQQSARVNQKIKNLLSSESTTNDLTEIDQ